MLPILLPYANPRRPKTPSAKIKEKRMKLSPSQLQQLISSSSMDMIAMHLRGLLIGVYSNAHKISKSHGDVLKHENNIDLVKG